MNSYLLGIDLAKNVFQLQAVDKRGKILGRKRVGRASLMKSVEGFSPKIVAMEACGSAHYWARQFQAKGMKVNLIPPQHVKPFVQTNKNDAADCDAICLAAMRPNLKFVSVKKVWHHDLQSLHRIRQQFVSHRVSLGNSMRGLLSEYGVIVPKGVAKFKTRIKDLISNEKLEADLSMQMRSEIEFLFGKFEEADKAIQKYSKQIEDFSKKDETCKRLMQLPGVGPMVATALSCFLVDANDFKNGRQASACLGLVPRHCASGEKSRNLGIGKRGDKYCKTLLIHGARASLLTAHKRNDKLSQWSLRILEKKGFNKAAVALANKNVRHIWAMMKKGDSFKMAA